MVGAVGVAVIALALGIGVAAVDVIVVVVYAECAVAAICLVQCAASDTALVASGVGVAERVLAKLVAVADGTHGMGASGYVGRECVGLGT